ncbi:MAG: undecaprenyl-diphosphate phosphatase [Pseudomonadota bacterium]
MEVIITFIQCIALAIMQGLTEFLPVSSSGHLVLLSKLFGLNEPSNFYDVLLHVGTLLSVIVVFYKDILMLINRLFIMPQYLLNKNKFFKKDYDEDKYLRFLIGIFFASIPTAIIGLLLKDFVENLARSYFWVGVMLFVTAFLLIISGKIKAKNNEEVNIKKSLIIGIAQGLAVIPGISRSGFTIASGLLLKLNREDTGKFAFLMSIPAIAGAFLLKLSEVELVLGQELLYMIVGFFVTFIVGIFALKLLLKMILKGSFIYFAYYCIVIGVLSVIMEFL